VDSRFRCRQRRKVGRLPSFKITLDHIFINDNIKIVSGGFETNQPVAVRATVTNSLG